jgi:hypothetical protein
VVSSGARVGASPDTDGVGRRSVQSVSNPGALGTRDDPLWAQVATPRNIDPLARRCVPGSGPNDRRAPASATQARLQPVDRGHGRVCHGHLNHPAVQSAADIQTPARATVVRTSERDRRHNRRQGNRWWPIPGPPRAQRSARPGNPGRAWGTGRKDAGSTRPRDRTGVWRRTAPAPRARPSGPLRS